MLRDTMPKMLGSYSDGNPTSPGESPEEYFVTLNDYDKALFTKLGIQTPTGLMRGEPVERPVYYPYWSMNMADGSPAALASQLITDVNVNFLSRLVTAPAGTFDILWNEYVAEIQAVDQQPIFDFFTAEAARRMVAFGGNVSPTDPLGGAASWHVEELEKALDAGLIPDAFIGNWTQPTSRLLAADAIVRLVESITGKSIDVIAVEKGYNMNDRFADTNDRAVTFLRASGISTGVDNINYDPAGIFTRAQMVTMLGRMAENVIGMNLSGYQLGTEVFTDVPDWPGTNQAIGWAAAVGITQGVGGGLFDSNGTLTNQQTGAFSYRTFDRLRIA
jgi:hypothetical protein